MKVKDRKRNEDRNTYRKYLETLETETLKEHQVLTRAQLNKSRSWFKEDYGHKVTDSEMNSWSLMGQTIIDISFIVKER